MDTARDMNDFEVVTRHIVMERDLNSFGNLFGGAMMAWLDEAAALFVMEKSGYADFVTVSFDNVRFKAPGRRGDAIVIYCRVVKTGRSSITVEAQAFVNEPQSSVKRQVIDCRITYVCLENGKPTPYFESERYARWLRKQE
jgi:acyl-CoA thioesterase YciA